MNVSFSSVCGDNRLALWEKLCTCGGERKSPDVRMCSCSAPEEAGLGCDKCSAGVLLIKQGPRGFFWGCSMFKKKGCKFTKKFGAPHDGRATKLLEQLELKTKTKRLKRQQQEEAIVDPHEKEWHSMCHCNGAKHLNTLECFLQSEGGCGMLPFCPRCDEALLLKSGMYGQYWECKSKKCSYRKSYIPHKKQKQASISSSMEKKREIMNESSSRSSKKARSSTTVPSCLPKNLNKAASSAGASSTASGKKVIYKPYAKKK